MRVRLKGSKLILSEAPIRDVQGAFLVRTSKKKGGEKMTVVKLNSVDARKGQKDYDLPKGITKKDVESVYLRVL